MNIQALKKCKVLGEYHGMSQPWVKSEEEHREFYKQHKESVNKESLIYSRIVNDRKKLGGDKKIHNI